MKIDKLLSARFWMALLFTVASCWGFMIGKIPGEQFTGIVMVVVTFYFNRERNQ